MHSMPSAPVGAVIAAAGRSTRMGSPKQLLPWGDTTVLGAVTANLQAAGVHPVVCVVGHLRDQVSALAEVAGADVVFNPDYAEAEMLVSYQIGVRYLIERQVGLSGALFAVGDQPHIPVALVRQVIHHALARPHTIVIPSFARRRGHPIYVPAFTWSFLLELGRADSLRNLLNRFADRIEYVDAADDAILRDMDTPEAYQSLNNNP